MLAEHLEDWDAARHELEHVVALEFASGGDGTEDHADVSEASAADLRGVGHGLEDLVSWSPSLMPEADRLAATVAASPNPNAVPLTDASASFMISVTLALSWPRP